MQTAGHPPVEDIPLHDNNPKSLVRKGRQDIQTLGKYLDKWIIGVRRVDVGKYSRVRGWPGSNKIDDGSLFATRIGPEYHIRRCATAPELKHCIVK